MRRKRIQSLAQFNLLFLFALIAAGSAGHPLQAQTAKAAPPPAKQAGLREWWPVNWPEIQERRTRLAFLAPSDEDFRAARAAAPSVIRERRQPAASPETQRLSRLLKLTLDRYYEWDRQLEAVVFAGEEPFAAIYGGLLVAVSDKTMALLTDEELEAVLAHEAAHLLVSEWEPSPALEIVCDAIAFYFISQVEGARRSLPQFLGAANKMCGSPALAAPTATHPGLSARLDSITDFAIFVTQIAEQK